MYALLWLAVAAAQTAPIDEFRAAYKRASEEARIRAVDSLAGRGGAKAIPVLAEVLANDTEAVRVAAARALGAYDEAAAVEPLGKALEVNAKSTKIVQAVVCAIEELDRQSSAPILHGLLRKHDRPEMFDAMPGLLRAIGRIGSTASVDPLLDLLLHAEREGRPRQLDDRVVPGCARHLELQPAIHRALREITGGRETSSKKWDLWWTERGKALPRMNVYRCVETGKRWEQKGAEPACPHHDKPRTHGELVKNIMMAP